MRMKHVVVDGSNIATEGREAPSLAQLDEAVRAFIDEYHPKVVTVVVDATFPNRVTPKERRVFEDAVAANELITPPAGAIGRGDAFVLQIAAKANAVILSNDSFQEFHGDHPWLFEKGRLIGGKPVPHVGWVFMERTPVRGPTSRRAVSDAKKVAKTAAKVAESAEKVAQAAETVEAEAAPPPRKRRSRRKAAEVAATAALAPDGQPEPVAAAAPPEADAAAGAPAPDGDAGRSRRPSGREAPRSAKAVEPYNDALPFIEFVGAHPVGSEVDATVERFSSHGAYVTVGAARAYLPLRNLADPPPRSAKEVLELGQQLRLVVVAIDPPLRGIDLAVPGVVAPVTPSPTDVAGEMAEVIAEAAPEAEPETVAAAKRAVAESQVSSAETPSTKAGGTEAAEPTASGRRSSRGRRSTKPAAKRTPDEVAAARKAGAKKAAATRAAKRRAAAGGTAATVAAGEEAAADASAAKTPGVRKPAARTSAAKKAAAKRTAAKTAGAKKSATRKAAAKTAGAKKSPARRPAGTTSGATPSATGKTSEGTSAAGEQGAVPTEAVKPAGSPGGSSNGAAPDATARAEDPADS